MHLLYELPEPFMGSTHIDFYEVTVTPRRSVRLTGWYGVLDVEGAFERRDPPRVMQPVRNIAGREFSEGFVPDVHARAAAAGAADLTKVDFRGEDLASWMDEWECVGDGEEWYTVHPEAEA